MMKRVVADKIASVTIPAGLRRDLRISSEIVCEEGSIVAVRVLNAKTQYNTLELTTGRFATVKPGDVIVGALGFRNALLGYAGTLPTSLKPGEKTQLLNMGGVVGHCTSYSPSVGEPFQVEVLGQALAFPKIGSRSGVPAILRDFCPPLRDDLPKISIPIVAVVGTCMNSGKTEACLSIIQQFVRRGLTVAAAKTTGVSLRRDVLAMDDAGASQSLIFTDFGIVTTSRANAAELTCTMVHRLAETQPDVIVLELGDGLMGDYGVDAILEHPSLRSQFTAVALAANDPVGAWGGVQLLRDQFGMSTTVITGPSTDNQAGVKILTNRLGVPGHNARTDAANLSNCLWETLRKAS